MADKQLELCDVISMASSTDLPTPTYSVADTVTDRGGIDNSSVPPWPGNTYIIFNKETGLSITVVSGKLQVVQELTLRGGHHWDCVEKNGWLGFRNCVSGKFIGHDSKGNFIATVNHHQTHEYFCARKHPDGGYVLLMRHGDTMMKMAIAGDEKTLVETKHEGTRWEFIRG